MYLDSSEDEDRQEAVLAPGGHLRDVVLLGPQRRDPTLRAVLDERTTADSRWGGRIATVTAGWEEREDEDAELRAHLERDTTPLALFPRLETVFHEDTDLFAAWREKREMLREEDDLYRMRLTAQLDVVRELFARDTTPAVEAARKAAVRSVWKLDLDKQERVAEIEDEFASRTQLADRPSIVRQRDQVAQLLEGSDVLAIAGGHVGVLLHRLRTFDVLGLWRDRPIVAWSAGAMVLSDLIVLFHDNPPQGPGDAEVYGPGLDRCTGLVFFPHPRHRLALDDERRVAQLAQRFGGHACVTMPPGARIEFNQEGEIIVATGVHRMTDAGLLEEIATC